MDDLKIVRAELQELLLITNKTWPLLLDTLRHAYYRLLEMLNKCSAINEDVNKALTRNRAALGPIYKQINLAQNRKLGRERRQAFATAHSLLQLSINDFAEYLGISERWRGPDGAPPL